MRRINAWLFVTLDGVTESPEKWVRGDDEMFAAQEADYAESDALLLGRRTYETFAASWPQRGSEVANADWMNSTPKYVASTTLESPEWNNTTVIEGDIVEALTRLKQQGGKTIVVNGSATLIRSLLRDHLLDAPTLRASRRGGLRGPAVRGRRRSRRARTRGLAPLRQRGHLAPVSALRRLRPGRERSGGSATGRGGLASPPTAPRGGYRAPTLRPAEIRGRVAGAARPV